MQRASLAPVRAACAGGPVALVLEDLHRGDLAPRQGPRRRGAGRRRGPLPRGRARARRARDRRRARAARGDQPDRSPRRAGGARGAAPAARARRRGARDDRGDPRADRGDGRRVRVLPGRADQAPPRRVPRRGGAARRGRGGARRGAGSPAPHRRGDPGPAGQDELPRRGPGGPALARARAGMARRGPSRRGNLADRAGTNPTFRPLQTSPGDAPMSGSTWPESLEVGLGRASYSSDRRPPSRDDAARGSAGRVPEVAPAIARFRASAPFFRHIVLT